MNMKMHFFASALAAGALLLSSNAFAADGKCPETTKLETLNGWDAYKKSGPYDMSSIDKASATYGADKKTHIVISNQEIKADAVASNTTVSQVKEKGKLALDILLSNSSKPLVAGEYSPKNRFGKMGVHTTLMIGGDEATASGLSATDGTVKVEEVTEDKVCGTFDLVTPYGPVKGQFVAPMEKKVG